MPFSQCNTWSYNEKMYNVAGIWLKRRYIDKMLIYSRPGKIICILIERSVQSMDPVSSGVHPLRLAPYYTMTLKSPPPHLLVHPSLISRKIMERHYYSFFRPLIFPEKTLCQTIHLLSGQTNSPRLH